MSVDVQGVESFRRAAAANAALRRAMTTIFIVVDHERLLARMTDRGHDDQAEIERRMIEACVDTHAADSATNAATAISAGMRRRSALFMVRGGPADHRIVF